MPANCPCTCERSRRFSANSRHVIARQRFTTTANELTLAYAFLSPIDASIYWRAKYVTVTIVSRTWRQRNTMSSLTRNIETDLYRV